MIGRRMVVAVAFLLWGGAALAEGQSYLYGEIAVPRGALGGLAERAEALGIPVAMWGADGLVAIGAADEEALLAAGVYLYLDGDQFLIGLDTPVERAVLRGDGTTAQLIVWAGGDVLVPPSELFLDLLRELGLLKAGTAITLVAKEIPLKLPRVPEGLKLDPTLWALLNHPDWFRAAGELGLARVGLRVRVVAEGQGALSEKLEPYVLSSTGTLMDVLIPIGLLPELGRDPAVKVVRPPLVPHPAGG